MILTLVGAILGSGGVTAIALALLNRKWAKDDKRDALVSAQKLIMLDHYRFLAHKYIAETEITLEDKLFMDEVFASYKALGGNGHLDAMKSAVDRLPVVGV